VRLIGGLGAVTILLFVVATPAGADLTHGVDDVTASASDRSRNEEQLTRKQESEPVESSPSKQAARGDVHQQSEEARRAEMNLRRQVETYSAALDAWRTCMSQTRQPVVAGDAAQFCTQPIPPDFATEVPGTLVTNAAAAVPGGPQIFLTPEQVAYIAFARLHLEPLKPVIGPPPELNRWKMAAVGYPLWLSGGGDAHPPAVWDQVFNLRVRLEARVKRVDFLMGDGNVVTCDGPGLPWTPAVKPGDRSPACGYQYAKPSLPEGNYTVTARTHWNVNWTINSQTGVIPMIQASSVELPVGELQVLIR
jgi:hypothetical protein